MRAANAGRRLPGMRFLLASLALLALAPATAVAAYTPPRTAYFLASAEGSQTTVWNEPAHDTYTDCKGTLWFGSKGSETTRWSTKTVKVTASETPPGANWFYGAFSIADSPLGGLPGKVTVSREASYEGGLKDPGPCGGGDGSAPEQPTGCGSRSGKAQIGIGWGQGKVAPGTLFFLKGRSISECDIYVADDASDTWTDGVTERLSKSEVFGRRKVITVTGSRTFEGTARSATRGDVETTTTVHWTITLKRVQR